MTWIELNVSQRVIESKGKCNVGFPVRYPYLRMAKLKTIMKRSTAFIATCLGFIMASCTNTSESLFVDGVKARVAVVDTFDAGYYLIRL